MTGQPTQQPQTLREKFRFSLGSIFGIIFSAALVLGWITQIMIPQNEAAEEAIGVFAAHGGRGYDHSFTVFGVTLNMDLQYSTIGPEGLRKLAANPVVASLDLSKTQITDDDLLILREADALQRLRLVEVKVSEEAIARLQSARPDLEIVRQ